MLLLDLVVDPSDSNGVDLEASSRIGSNLLGTVDPLSNIKLKTRLRSKVKRLKYKLPKSQVYRNGDHTGTIRAILTYDIINERL